MGEPRLRRRTLRAAISLVAVAVTLVAASRARAATDPGETCRRTQIGAANKLYKQSHSCWSKAFNNLSFDPFVCLVKAEDKFRDSYAGAAAKAAKAGSQCGLRLRVDALLSIAAGDVDPLVGAIAGSVDLDSKNDRKLRAKLMGLAGSFAKRAFDAELDFAKRADDARLDQKLAAARGKLESSFASAIASAAKHGVPYDGLESDTTGDVLAAAAELWERLTRAGNGAFTVSGSVIAAESTFVDSDVNDPSMSPDTNDSFFEAKPLPVPATVGGYVNYLQAGPQGNSWEGGDPIDRYKAFLRAGQVIVLALGDDPSVVDLDLSIIGDAVPDGIDSWGEGPYEQIVVPADGNYFIEVFPYVNKNRAGTYTLSIGQTVPAAAAVTPRTDVEFVPGELIVKLRPQAAAAAGVSALRQHKPDPGAALGLETVAGDPSREMLMRLPVGAARAQTFQTLGATDQQQKLGTQSLSPAAVARRETLLALKALHARPDVEAAELNTILRPSAVPADPYYTLQWHYPLIHLPQAWDVVKGSPDVVVAVVDTGVRLDHPDLMNELVPGYDFISDPARARDGNGIDADPNDPGDRGSGAGSSSFHGTHVAGTIAAETDNGVGVAGVTWGSKVMPVRVLGVNGGTQYDVIQGVSYAAGLPNDSGTVPAKKADVINLSLGGGGHSQLAQDAFTAARAAGVIVVAAAGNDASSTDSYPASYVGVVSVAAVDLNRNPAPYSNFGDKVDVAAPGGDTSVDRNADTWADGVLSTLAEDGAPRYGYVFYQGTSMATPHVAGVFALMRSVDPSISPQTIDTLLAAGALTEDIGTPGRDDRTGYGLIDARAAVIAAGAPATGPAVPLSVTPSGLNFGLALDSLDFNVANAGSDPLTVTSVTVENPGTAFWLSLAPVSVDGSGLGRYRATVDRGGLAQKSYSATIDVVSSAGTTHIPVVMRVGGPTSSDAGFHYVLLVDAQSLTAIDQVPVAAVNGAYAYAFANVPEGDYLLIAGSDLDNDGLICDGGEACGSYPTLDLPAPLTVDKNRTGIDFGTAFQQSIGAPPPPEPTAASHLPAAGIRRLRR